MTCPCCGKPVRWWQRKGRTAFQTWHARCLAWARVVDGRAGGYADV